MSNHDRFYLAFASFLFTAAAQLSAQVPTDGQLHQAVRHRDTTAVKALLSGSFDPDFKDSLGISPRMRLESLTALLEKEPANPLLMVWAENLKKSINSRTADIDDIDSMGFTALQLAAFFGFTEIARMLLDRGAEINVGGKWGLARFPGMARFATRSSPLGLAALANHTSIVTLLLARSAFPNGVQGQDAFPLMTAIQQGHAGIARLLLAGGADVNLGTDSASVTALRVAVDKGSSELVDVLLEGGADILAMIRSPGGGLALTPLETARRKGLLEMVSTMETHFLRSITNPEKQLARLTQMIEPFEREEALRPLVIKLGAQMQPAPVIPEEARRHFIEGTEIFNKASSRAELVLALERFINTLKIAPWWGPAYYHLALTQENLGNPYQAESAFGLYLLSNPAEKWARDARDHIYQIGAKRKLVNAQKTDSLNAVAFEAQEAARAKAEIAAENAPFDWILGDWTYKSGGMYSSEPAKAIHFVYDGTHRITDSNHKFPGDVLVSGDGSMDWGRYFDIDHCGLKGVRHPFRITFSSDRRSAKILWPIVGLKCEIVYSEAESSGMLRRD